MACGHDDLSVMIIDHGAANSSQTTQMAHITPRHPAAYQNGQIISTSSRSALHVYSAANLAKNSEQLRRMGCCSANFPSTASYSSMLTMISLQHRGGNVLVDNSHERIVDVPH